MIKLIKIKQFFGVLVQHFLLSNGVGPVKTPGIFDEIKQTVTQTLGDFINNALEKIVAILASVALKIYEVLGLIVYFVSKIMLNVVDLIMVCVSELSGQASSYAISQNSNLESTDILFRFFLNEKVLTLLRRIFWFAIFVLILATIVALVKNEWNNANSDDKVKSPGRVLRNTIMSLLWMFLTPFLVIVAVVFCNVLLTSGMNALSGKNNSTAFSMGSTVFSTSAHTANRYRNYANDGKKIPILFNYQGGFNNVDNSDTGEESETLAEIKLSNANMTSEMFKNNNFHTFSDIARSEDSYYQVYDGDNIKTNRVEYYVMADFIDFAMDSGATFYIVNVEDVYKEAVDLYLTDGAEELRSEEASDQAYILNDILSSIKPYYFDSQNGNLETVITGPQDYAEKIENGTVIDNYKFVVSYNSKEIDRINETTNQFVLDSENEEYDFTVTSYAGSRDEAEGAKYLYCVKIPITYIDNLQNKVVREIYMPVSQNLTINDYYTFSSSYLSDAYDEEKEELVRPESYFIARGTFDDNGYPTAIKQSGNQVICYRHTVSNPTIFSYIPDFKFTAEEGETSPGHNASVFVEDLIGYVTGVDVSKMIPDYNVILEVSSSNLKTLDEVSRLDDGKFVLNYSFVNTQVRMNNIYNPQEINYLLLCLIGISYIKVFFKVLFGLFKRIFDLTILWVSYPAYLAAHPLEGDDFSVTGSRFGRWRNEFIQKLLLVWEIYLALAFYYMFIKIIMQVDFCDWVGDLVYESKGFLASFKYTPQGVAMIAKMMFMLAGLGMSIKDDGKKEGTFALASDFIGPILLPGITPNETAITSLGNIKDIKALKNQAQAVYSPQALNNVQEKAEKLMGNVARAIPGIGIASKVVGAARQFGAEKKLNKNMKKFKNDTTAIDTTGMTTAQRQVVEDNVTNKTKKLGRQTDKFVKKSDQIDSDVGKLSR